MLGPISTEAWLEECRLVVSHGVLHLKCNCHGSQQKPSSQPSSSTSPSNINITITIIINNNNNNKTPSWKKHGSKYIHEYLQCIRTNRLAELQATNFPEPLCTINLMQRQDLGKTPETKKKNDNTKPSITTTPLKTHIYPSKIDVWEVFFLQKKKVPCLGITSRS